MVFGAFEDIVATAEKGYAPPTLADVIQGKVSSGESINQAEAGYLATGLVPSGPFTGQTGAQLPPGSTEAWKAQANAGLATLLPAVGAAVPALAGVTGAAAALFGVYQALGGGEGGGLFGNNLLGGDGFTQGGIEFGGPGLAEPASKYVLKEWHVKYDWGTLQYYLVQMPTGGRKIAMYNTRTKRWKVWAWRKPHIAVIGKNLPSHKQITRLRRNLSRHKADAATILKLADPLGYAKKQGYRSYRKRR